MPEIKNRFGKALDVEVYFANLWRLITPFDETKYDTFFADATNVLSLEEWAAVRDASRFLPSHTGKTSSLWDDYVLFIKTIWPIKGAFCDELAIAIGNLLSEFEPQQAVVFYGTSLQRFKQYLLSLPRADAEHTLAGSCMVRDGGRPSLLSVLLDCWADKAPTPATFENLILWLADKAPRMLPKGPVFDAIYQKHKIGPYISNILLETHLQDLPCAPNTPQAKLKEALMQDLANGLELTSPKGVKTLYEIYTCRSKQIQDTDNDYFAQATEDNQRWFYFLELISHCADIKNPYTWLVPGLEGSEVAEEGLYWEFPPTRFIVSGDGKRLLYLPYLAKAILSRVGEGGQYTAKVVQCFDGETYRAFEHKEIERLRRSAFWLNQGLATCLEAQADEQSQPRLSEKTVKQVKMLLEGVFYSAGLFVEKSYSEEQNKTAINAFTNFILYLETLKAEPLQEEYRRLMTYPVTIHNREETFERWLGRVQDPSRQDNCIAVFSNALLEIVLDYYPQTKFNSPEVSAFKHLESQRSRSACYAPHDYTLTPETNYEQRIIRLAVSLFTKTFTTYYGFGKTLIHCGDVSNEVTESGLQLWRLLERYLEAGYSKKPHMHAFVWANCVELIQGTLANPSFGRAQATTAWLENLLKVDVVPENQTAKRHEPLALLAAMLDNLSLIKKKNILYGPLVSLHKDFSKTLSTPGESLSFKQCVHVHILWYKLLQAMNFQRLQSALQRYSVHLDEAKAKIQNSPMQENSAKAADTSSLTDRVVSATQGWFLWKKNTTSDSSPVTSKPVVPAPL